MLSLLSIYISLVIRHSLFPSKQSQKSRSVLSDGSRSMELLRKGKTHTIAKFQRTDLVICSHSRRCKTPSYSWINRIHIPQAELQHDMIFMPITTLENTYVLLLLFAYEAKTSI